MSDATCKSCGKKTYDFAMPKSIGEKIDKKELCYECFCDECKKLNLPTFYYLFPKPHIANKTTHSEKEEDKEKILMERFLNHPFFQFRSKDFPQDHEFVDFLELSLAKSNLVDNEDLKNAAELIGVGLGCLEEAFEALYMFKTRTEDEKLMQKS